MTTRFLSSLGWPWKRSEFVFLAFFLVFVSRSFSDLLSLARLRRPDTSVSALRNTFAQSPLVYDAPPFFNGRFLVLHYPGREILLGSHDVATLMGYFDTLIFFHSSKWVEMAGPTKAAWLKLHFCDLRIQKSLNPSLDAKPDSVEWFVRGYGEPRPALFQFEKCP